MALELRSACTVHSKQLHKLGVAGQSHVSELVFEILGDVDRADDLEHGLLGPCSRVAGVGRIGQCDVRGCAGRAVAARAADFRRWLINRPERRVVVFSHGVYLRHLLAPSPRELAPSFDNCEMRKVVL